LPLALVALLSCAFGCAGFCAAGFELSGRFELDCAELCPDVDCCVLELCPVVCAIAKTAESRSTNDKKLRLRLMRCLPFLRAFN